MSPLCTHTCILSRKFTHLCSSLHITLVSRMRHVTNTQSVLVVFTLVTSHQCTVTHFARASSLLLQDTITFPTSFVSKLCSHTCFMSREFKHPLSFPRVTHETFTGTHFTPAIGRIHTCSMSLAHYQPPHECVIIHVTCHKYPHTSVHVTSVYYASCHEVLYILTQSLLCSWAAPLGEDFHMTFMLHVTRG